jgi:ABC-type branched-subunit amino acid transport system permease subunit
VSVERETGPGGGVGATAGAAGRIGVDEWVARSAGRGGTGPGWQRRLRRLDQVVGWWPRLALVTLLGLAFGLLTGNVNLLTVGFNSLLYAILSLGLNIAVGWAGLLDLGYIAFFGFGAYGYAIFSSNALGTGGVGGTHLAAIESIPIVLVAAGVVGLAIGLVALRVGGDYLAIVTLFVGQAFVEVVNNVDPSTLGGVNGLFGLDPLHSFGGSITTPRGNYLVALGVAALVAAILHLLDTSRTGRAWRAIRDDPLAAEAMTIPVNKVKVMAFSFSAIVGALAGTLFAAEQTSVFPTNFSSSILILIYACLILGGAGSIAGAIAGGVIVTILEYMLASPLDAGYLFYGLVLIALIALIRPWRYLVAVIAGIIAFGFAAHAIVGAISSSAVAGSPGSHGWIGSVVSHWVIVPSDAVGYGNILFVAVIVGLLVMLRLHGIRRLLLVIPMVYIAACCWESRLIVNPAITTQIMLGAILIVAMVARPNGLLGSRRVEVV